MKTNYSIYIYCPLIKPFLSKTGKVAMKEGIVRGLLLEIYKH